MVGIHFLVYAVYTMVGIHAPVYARVHLPGYTAHLMLYHPLSARHRPARPWC